MCVCSWHPVPLRKIPCLSEHLLFLPVQQPGLASGNNASLTSGLPLSPLPGCRLQVPAGCPQRGPVTQALAVRGSEAGLRRARTLAGAWAEM